MFVSRRTLARLLKMSVYCIFTRLEECVLRHMSSSSVHVSVCPDVGHEGELCKNS